MLMNNPNMAQYNDIFKNKKVLITGGAGFIGSSLCIELVKLGSEVTVLDAMLPLYGGNLFNLESVRDKIKFVEGDIRDKELVNDLVRGQDFIYDFAAQVSHTDSKDLPFLDLDINGLGHMNVLEAARLYAPDAKYIFASSQMVYGKIQSNPVTEDHPTKPLSLYAIHKRLVENYCDYYFKTYGLKTIVVRMPNPYGPRQQMKHNKYSLIGWFTRLALEDQTIKIFGSGEQNRDYLYIDDIVEALLAVGHNGKAGEIYNLGTRLNRTLLDLVSTIIKEVGKGRKENIPWPDYYEKNEIGDYLADTSKIEKDTGWLAKTSLEDGIKSTVKYFRENLKSYWLGGDFSVELAARDYLEKKFPHSSTSDKERVIDKWVNKLRAGSGSAEDLESRIGPIVDKKILDAGSGAGIVSLGFAKKGAQVSGVEEDKMLVGVAQYIAQTHKQNINFVYSDLGQMPFPDDTFHAVVSIDVVNRVSNVRKYLEEVLRVLKVGGVVYLSFPTRTGMLFYNKRENLDESGTYSYGELIKQLKKLSSKHGMLYLQDEVSHSHGVKKIIKKLLSVLGLSHTIVLPQAVLTLIKK